MTVDMQNQIILCIQASAMFLVETLRTRGWTQLIPKMANNEYK